jgi:hypothetical protein
MYIWYRVISDFLGLRFAVAVLVISASDFF